ncbi:MAG: SLBB domain-containing protein [Candidatus Zixiibacteriota bacterium]
MQNRLLRTEIIFSFLWLFLLAATGFAQESLEAGFKARFLPPAVDFGQALESSIEPETYILGPGDMLQVDLWGEMPTSFQTIVTPEGTLLLPTVGKIEVGGLTLSKVKEVVKEQVLKRYRNVEITTTLVQLRNMRIPVTGAVRNPGMFTASSADRVSQVIAKAGGFIEKSETSRIQASERRVKVLHWDGSVDYADIQRYKVTGDLTCNPVVRDGDVIYVPVREDNINLCGIFGAVRAPGYFEYVPGDKLTDLIALAHGLTVNVDSLQAEIVRFGPDQVLTFTVPVDLSLVFSPGSRIHDIPLMPDDRVYIRFKPHFHEKHQVTVAGEVRFPGTYAIEEDRTTLSALIQMAGGVTSEASLAEAEMFRVAREEVVDPEFERLNGMEISDMSDSEYEYFKIKSLERPGKVSINLSGLLEHRDEAYEVLLRSGDYIRIPKLSKVVKVTGHVNNPGLIPYEPEWDYHYYIEKAGGFTSKARIGKVRIIKRASGERLKPQKRKPLEAGDTIWVPEKPDRDYWGFFKETLAFVGNLATVYLVIQQATK